MQQSSKNESAPESTCSTDCCKAELPDTLACKLTTAALRERKETVLASLRKQILQRNELSNGFAYTFEGTDAVLDELNEFIKTERQCCDFFTFTIITKGDQRETILEITGPNGAKGFITSELDL